MKTLLNRRVQLPVGQGCFHFGQIGVSTGRPFTYVYDCGSRDGKPLSRELRGYIDADPRGLDMLVLSHLHDDHVAGLDKLLVTLRPTWVVLPYIDQRERLLFVARAAANGGIGRDSVEFLLDPAAWIRGRGVEQVIEVTAGEAGESDIGNLPDPDWPAEDGEPPFRVGDPTELDGDSLPKQGATNGNSGALRMNHSRPIRLKVNTARLNWMLKTFVAPVDSATLAQFDAVLKALGLSSKQLLGKQGRVRRILDLLSSAQKRRALVSAYKAISTNLNLTSLSLYSGPVNRQVRVRHHYVFGGEVLSPAHAGTSLRAYLPPNGKHTGAWIGTGDSDLRGPTLASFIAHFASETQQPPSHLTMPHHGSIHNSDESIYRSLRPRICSVSSRARQQRGYHPNAAVVAFADTHCEVVVRTTEAPRSRLEEGVWLEPS